MSARKPQSVLNAARIAEAKLALRAKIAEIKADDRYKDKPALVQINAPLALIQVSMKAHVSAYTFALDLLTKPRDKELLEELEHFCDSGSKQPPRPGRPGNT